MGSIAKKGLNNYVQQLQQHPLRTKVITAGVLSGISDVVSQKLTGIQKLQFKRLLLKVAIKVDLKNSQKLIVDLRDVWQLRQFPSLYAETRKEDRAGNKMPCPEILQVLQEVFNSLKMRGSWFGHKLTYPTDCKGIVRVRYGEIFGAAYLGPSGHYFHIILDKIFKGKKDSKTVAKKVLIEQLTSSPLNNLLFLIYYGLAIEGRPWAHVKAKVKKDYPSVQYTSWTFWPVVGWINHKFLPLHFRVVFHSLVAFCWGIFLNLRARSMALIKA